MSYTQPYNHVQFSILLCQQLGLRAGGPYLSHVKAKLLTAQVNCSAAGFVDGSGAAGEYPPVPVNLRLQEYYNRQK